MAKKKNKKPKSVEEELMQVQKCLKNKDKRIKTLENANKDAEENKTYLVDTFNFLSLFFFTISIFVLLIVANHFHHQWFMDVAPTLALWGCFCFGGNLFIGITALIYEKSDDPYNTDTNIAMVYIVFNCIILPVVIGLYWLVVAMIESMKTAV